MKPDLKWDYCAEAADSAEREAVMESRWKQSNGWKTTREKGN